MYMWKKGWHSGESRQLSLMWHGLESPNRHHKCVGFFVWLHLSRGFLRGLSGFPTPYSPYNLIWNQRITGLLPLLNQANLFILFIYFLTQKGHGYVVPLPFFQNSPFKVRVTLFALVTFPTWCSTKQL